MASVLLMNIQGLIAFRIDWFDLLFVKGTLKCLLQYHSSKASILWHSAFFMVQLSHLHPSLVAQMVKSLPAIEEARVQSPGQEDPIEKGMATHSSILAWRIPWIEETTEKTIALIIQKFVSKVMSLLFNVLSRFVIAFLPRNKRLLISWLQ